MRNSAFAIAVLASVATGLVGCKTVPIESNKDSRYEAQLKLDWTVPPSCPKITSDYASLTAYGGAYRNTPHTGIDIHVPIGTTIMAPHAGRVISVGSVYEGGNILNIDHGMDQAGNKVMAVFMHISSATVQPGDIVKRGQPIALSGASGTGTKSGPHLHFEVTVTSGGFVLRRNGWIDGVETRSPHGYWFSNSSKTDGSPQIPVPENVTDPAEWGGQFRGFSYPISCGAS